MDLGTVKSKIERETYTDKSSCLQDINQVWLNAKKFNPKPHAVHQAADFLQKQMFIMLENLVKSGGATGRKSLPAAIPAPPPMRHVGIREAKKRPIGLPGEYDDIKPQHLEQKVKLFFEILSDLESDSPTRSNVFHSFIFNMFLF